MIKIELDGVKLDTLSKLLSFCEGSQNSSEEFGNKFARLNKASYDAQTKLFRILIEIPPSIESLVDKRIFFTPRHVTLSVLDILEDHLFQKEKK